MLKILQIVPGGQNLNESPSEHLARKMNLMFATDVEIHTWNILHQGVFIGDFDYFDLIWGEMDGMNVPIIARDIAKKHDKKLYIHAEWIPPFRVMEDEKLGLVKRFGPLQLQYKQYYMEIMNAMTDADLVSLAHKYEGGFDWIKKHFGYEYENKFLRVPACPKYERINCKRKYQVATIARNAYLKKVFHTEEAISRIHPKPAFKWIGGRVKYNLPKKVKVFAESSVAVQIWSGIPPAEAIQQFCPVVSYDIPEMRFYYGDALIWVKEDDINGLKEKIEFYLNNPKQRQVQAEKAYALFDEGKLAVKYEDDRARLVYNKIKELFD